MYFKKEIETTITATPDGYLEIGQGDFKVVLSASQVAKISKWLVEGNGLCLEHDWRNGVEGAED